MVAAPLLAGSRCHLTRDRTELRISMHRAAGFTRALVCHCPRLDRLQPFGSVCAASARNAANSLAVRTHQINTPAVNARSLTLPSAPLHLVRWPFAFHRREHPPSCPAGISISARLCGLWISLPCQPPKMKKGASRLAPPCRNPLAIMPKGALQMGRCQPRNMSRPLQSLSMCHSADLPLLHPAIARTGRLLITTCSITGRANNGTCAHMA